MIAPRARCVMLIATVLLGGCERSMHDMYDQAKYKTLAPSPLFDDGRSERRPPRDSVALDQGAIADSSSGRRGAAAVDDAMPKPITMAMLVRGRQRYQVYCEPCHGAGGDGDGMVVRRGFPTPPSYHTDRLRDAPDQHLYQVISNGYGIMYRYGDRIAADDRWAIVAYIRALQLSRHATRDRLAPQDLRQLNASAKVKP